ncbi:MAG: hypothetical protein PVJ73_02680 [Acidobacteriota bacterium]|jgi:hypothetical protein
MERWVPCLLSLGLLAPAARAEVVEVRVSGERVDVTATTAPLADVLDRLAQQTGMEIVYEGQPPRQRITLALEGRSPAEAVQGILEGQGLNYALVADPSGRGVQTLLLAGPAGTGSSLPAPSAPRRAPVARRPIIPPGASPEMMGPDFAGMDEEDPFEDPDFPGEEPFDDPELMDEEPPEGEAPVTSPAGVPAAGPVPPAAGPLPFPGGQPQVYPASPFAPQPFLPSPAPEGTPADTTEPE